MFGDGGGSHYLYVEQDEHFYHNAGQSANRIQTTDVRISEDAGRYLCDFIYYSSMAHLTKEDEDRRVVFLHVPVESDSRSIDTGVEVAVELIRALVQSGRMKKLVQD